jgi:hypothetical protein
MRTFSRPVVNLFALRHHRTTWDSGCEFPIYRPTGQMLKGFTDCDRSPTTVVSLPGAPEPRHYCTQHAKMAQAIVGRGS